jgi:hypothetical protein
MFYRAANETYGLEKLNWGPTAYRVKSLHAVDYSNVGVRIAYRHMKASPGLGPEQIARMLIEAYSLEKVSGNEYAPPSQNEMTLLQAGYRLFQDLVCGPVGLLDLMRALHFTEGVATGTHKVVIIGHNSQLPCGYYLSLNIARLLGWVRIGPNDPKHNGLKVKVSLVSDEHPWASDEYFAAHTRRRPDPPNCPPYGWKAIEK